MTKEFKRTFFSSLIAVLLIISNLIGLKYTNFANYVLPVNFITYPLISLCIVMLVDLYGRRTAKQSVYVGFYLQLFMLIIYLLTTNLSSQTMISDMAFEVNRVFDINIITIVTSLVAYLALSYVTINLFENFKNRNQRSVGSLVCIFSFTVLYGAVYLLMTNYTLGYETLLKLLYTHLVSALFMTMVSYGIYYVFRETFDFYEPEMVSTKDKSLSTLMEEEEFVDNTPKSIIRKKRKPRNRSKSNKSKTSQNKDK